MEEPSDDEVSVKSDDRSSLKSDDSLGSNRVKYLYSYGGKILPRPSDGKLRYGGGETRVMAASRNIAFADLIAKMGEVSGSSPVLKCQLPGEDLDALVSIKSDEDLENVLEEYDRLQTRKASSKVRAFLFPKPASPLSPPVAADYMAARGGGGGCGGGHMDPDCERAILHERANSCYDASSAPRGAYPMPSRLHGFEKHSCPCDSHTRQPPAREGVSIPGRPPRSPVHPDGQFGSPVRYDRVPMPPRQNCAVRSVSTSSVDDGQFLHVANPNHCQYASASPAAQIPFPGKATKVREEYRHISQNPYFGAGLKDFHVQRQFLVQH